jgi:tRNA(fMet)-specific endonuclease VapC
MILVADTDVLIDFLRGKGESADRVEMELKTGKLYTTTITTFELWAGVRGPKEAAAIETLIKALNILNLDLEAAQEAAEIKKSLDENGITIGMADSIIAGICRNKKGMLLTRNKKHFSRVQGLKLADNQKTEP